MVHSNSVTEMSLIKALFLKVWTRLKEAYTDGEAAHTQQEEILMISLKSEGQLKGAVAETRQELQLIGVVAFNRENREIGKENK